MKKSKPEYLAKALMLSAEEQERVLSRMTGKLPNRLEKDKLSVDEALAIQLELEDEQLNEWREKMHAINEKAKKKDSVKNKAGDAPAAKATPERPAKRVPVAAKPRAAKKPKPSANPKE